LPKSTTFQWLGSAVTPSLNSFADTETSIFSFRYGCNPGICRRTVQRSDLPFGSEFSPSQIELPALLEIAEAHQGDPRALEGAILKRYFSGHAQGREGEEAAYNRGKLANNCKLGLKAYGVIDRQANLTDFGRRLTILGQAKRRLTGNWRGTFSSTSTA